MKNFYNEFKPELQPSKYQILFAPMGAFLRMNLFTLNTLSGLQEITYKKLCVEHSSIWSRDLDYTESKIKALEVCCWRRTLKIPWTEKIKE